MLIHEFEVGEELFREHRFHLLNGLQLYYHLVVDHEVESERGFEFIAFISDRDFNLPGNLKASLL